MCVWGAGSLTYPASDGRFHRFITQNLLVHPVQTIGLGQRPGDWVFSILNPQPSTFYSFRTWLAEQCPTFRTVVNPPSASKARQSFSKLVKIRVNSRRSPP